MEKLNKLIINVSLEIGLQIFSNSQLAPSDFAKTFADREIDQKVSQLDEEVQKLFHQIMAAVETFLNTAEQGAIMKSVLALSQPPEAREQYLKTKTLPYVEQYATYLRLEQPGALEDLIKDA